MEAERSGAVQGLRKHILIIGVTLALAFVAFLRLSGGTPAPPLKQVFWDTHIPPAWEETEGWFFHMILGIPCNFSYAGLRFFGGALCAARRSLIYLLQETLRLYCDKIISP